MNIVRLKISDLKLAENNVRMHPRKQVDEYIRSLKMFGQVKNAVVDEDYNVLIGNGLVMAAKELGWDEVYAFIIPDLSEAEKKKLMLSDNKIFGLGVDNLNTIDAFFAELNAFSDLDIPGYDEEILKTMVGTAETVVNEIIQYGKLSAEEISGIKERPQPAVRQETSSAQQQDSYSVFDDETHTLQQSAASAVNNESYQANNSIEDTSILSSTNPPLTNLANDILICCPKCGEEIWLSKDVLRQLMY